MRTQSIILNQIYSDINFILFNGTFPGRYNQDCSQSLTVIIAKHVVEEPINTKSPNKKTLAMGLGNLAHTELNRTL